MRHWLAVCMMGFSMAAAADPAMISDRGKAGLVVLTSEAHAACGDEQRIAYLTRLLDPGSRHRDTITYWGCWEMARNTIHVHYFIGKDDSYRRGDFTLEDVPRRDIPQPGPPKRPRGNEPDAGDGEEGFGSVGQSVVWRP